MQSAQGVPLLLAAAVLQPTGLPQGPSESAINAHPVRIIAPPLKMVASCRFITRPLRVLQSRTRHTDLRGFPQSDSCQNHLKKRYRQTDQQSPRPAFLQPAD